MAINFTIFSEETLDQAISWVSRLRSDQVTEADQADFALWLNDSNEHQAAFDEAMILWESMGVAASTMTIPTSNSPEEISGYLSKNPLSEELTASNDSTLHSNPFEEVSKSNRSKLKKLSWLTAAAASILAVGFLFIVNNTPHLQNTPIAQQLFATEVGSKQRFTLSDGSIVELNTNSRVTVEYSKSLRSLTLLEGEAFFKVVHNPDRPFVVTANNGVVTAVGTAFNINLDESRMTVAVTEGLIRVSRLDELDKAYSDNSHNLQNNQPQKKPNEIFVDVGYQLIVDDENIGKKELADLNRIIAWRDKTLIFKNMDLALALSELNRYLKTPVDTSHDSLHKLRISGTFSLDEPEATLDAIIASFELQAYKSPINDKTRLLKETL